MQGYSLYNDGFSHNPYSTVIGTKAVIPPIQRPEPAAVLGIAIPPVFSPPMPCVPIPTSNS